MVMVMNNLIPLPKGPSAQLPAAVRAVGIDLGTTNSTVAEAIWSGPEEFTLRTLEIEQPTPAGMYTHVLVPSIVAIDDGRLVIGEGAKRLRAKAGESNLELYRSIFWETKNHIGMRRTYNRAPEQFRSAREIAAHLLRFLHGASRNHHALPASRTVITVPASFQFNQRRDTLEAARLAGIDLQPGDLLDEPIAAFLDYLNTAGVASLGRSDSPHRLLVFDFGGGTCDIALFQFQVPADRGPLEVAPACVSRYYRLGGGDIDAAIVDEVLIPQLCRQNRIGKDALDYDMIDKFVMPALLGVAEAL